MLTQLKTKLYTSLETYLTRNNTKNKQKWLTSGLTKLDPNVLIETRMKTRTSSLALFRTNETQVVKSLILLILYQV